MPKSGESTTALVERLYSTSLSRQPTPDELTSATSILGSSPTAESLSDLLWAILMLPEFQLVR